MKIKLGVLISGSGTNLQAIIDACAKEDFPASVDFVLSNKADAYGLYRAKENGLHYAFVDHTKYKTREKFELQVSKLLHAHKVELICLAGFMRILGPDFIKEWSGRIINIHPSLLPQYQGLNTHQRAIDAKDKVAGCTVHYVDEGVDTGPVVAQMAIPLYGDDTADSLAQRVLVEEHRLYPHAIQLVCNKLLAEKNS
jgi:phosphoribosylglycinamide formyltransferase 1